MTKLPLSQILIGDAHELLQRLPDASVDCAITSPPYFAMRDYGRADQLGNEPHVDAWADSITAVCAELWRVLTPTGSLWLNLGDGFARRPSEGGPRKSLLLGPQRVALRLTRAGWILRNQVIWAKRNPMPSSVTDRLSNGHEVILFLTKQARYYFDLDAIREPVKATTTMATRTKQPTYPPRGAVPSLGGGHAPRIDLNTGLAAMKAAGRSSHPRGKNPGDVWWLATATYRDAHFATFPVDLVRRPLLATCPAKVCTACGQPWQPATVDRRNATTGPLQGGCTCNAPPRSGIVLDPFMGAGTVALAAEQHGRDWLGIELNPDYAALAKQRLTDSRTRHQPKEHSK